MQIYQHFQIWRITITAHCKSEMGLFRIVASLCQWTYYLLCTFLFIVIWPIWCTYSNKKEPTASSVAVKLSGDQIIPPQPATELASSQPARASSSGPTYLRTAFSELNVKSRRERAHIQSKLASDTTSIHTQQSFEEKANVALESELDSSHEQSDAAEKSNPSDIETKSTANFQATTNSRTEALEPRKSQPAFHQLLHFYDRQRRDQALEQLASAMKDEEQGDKEMMKDENISVQERINTYEIATQNERFQRQTINKREPRPVFRGSSVAFVCDAIKIWQRGEITNNARHSMKNGQNADAPPKTKLALSDLLEIIRKLEFNRGQVMKNDNTCAQPPEVQTKQGTAYEEEYGERKPKIMTRIQERNDAPVDELEIVTRIKNLLQKHQVIGQQGSPIREPSKITRPGTSALSQFQLMLEKKDEPKIVASYRYRMSLKSNEQS